MSAWWRFLRFGIVVLWGVLLITLYRTQRTVAPADSGTVPEPAAASSDQPGADEWHGIYMRGDKVGYAHGRVTETADGHRLEETSVMRLTILDQVQTIRASIDADAAPDWSVRRFSVALSADVGDFSVHGVVEGNVLQLRLSSGSEISEERIPLPEPIYLPSTARARAHASRLQPGATTTVQVFDPTALAQRPMTLTVIGRQALATAAGNLDTWHLRESLHGVESEVWIDEAGQAVREEGPMGLTIVRETAAEALEAGWRNTPVDLIGVVAVRPAQAIIDPRTRTALRLRMQGVEGLMVPVDGRQHLSEGVVEIRREPESSATFDLPDRSSERKAETEATAFLQSDHVTVRAAARAAVGETRDARTAALRLRRWVFERLDKRPVATIPNAVQVLQMGTGDCNEHAVLFAALARSIGLPARVVAGLVYVDGAFLYHAWNEVWLGEAWISVDPTFDQMPADATHIKFVEGGPEAHASLIPLLGRLRIEVVAQR